MKTIQISSSIRQIIGMVVMVLCALGALPTYAASTTLTFNWATSKTTVETENLLFGNKTDNPLTGAYQVMQNTTPFWVYCLDPLDYFGYGSSAPTWTATYNTSDLSTFVKNGGYATEFKGSSYQATDVVNHYDDSNTTPDIVLAKLQDLYAHAYYDSMTSIDKSAAFQYAIWEIEGDSSGGNGYSSSTGGLKFASGVTSGFASQVNQYLTALNTATGTGSWSNIGLGAVNSFIFTVYTATAMAAGQAFSQTVVNVTPNGTVTANNAVPEPASYMLLGIGLFALGASRRQSKANTGILSDCSFA